MISVVCWRWGKLFEPHYVSRLRNMLARHLHRDHELICVTDDPRSIPPGIRTVRITELQNTPRCRRRMKQYDREFAGSLGTRILSIDLDVVIVDDITPLVDRREPIVLWKVGYAGVYSGSFVLYDYTACHSLWERYAADPEGFPRQCGPGVQSDQAMLNRWILERNIKPGEWTEDDGFVSWFGGERYRSLQHHGMGPDRPEVPKGARIVVLGSADKAVLDEGRYAWADAWADAWA